MFVLVFTAVLLMTLGAIGEVVDRCAQDPSPPARLRLVPTTVDTTGPLVRSPASRHPYSDAGARCLDQSPLRRCG
jgi:hypothetical protein